MLSAGFWQHLQTHWVYWQARLNETQTQQAVVLPLLHSLGWNPFNPFEVDWQNGWVRLRPDLGGPWLLCAPLGQPLSLTQRSQGLQQASLTPWTLCFVSNGWEWEVWNPAQPAAPALALQLSETRAQAMLERLLSRSLWEDSHNYAKAQELCQHFREEQSLHLHLASLENKIRARLARGGFSPDSAGLRTLIEESPTLNPAERWQALELWNVLAERILGLSPNPTPETTRVLAALREGLRQASEHGRNLLELQVWLAGEEQAVGSWRNLHTGLAEAYLLLGQSEALEQIGGLHASPTERLKRSGQPYPAHGYRQLSNGRYLFLHMSASAHLHKVQRLAKGLELTEGILAVEYAGERYEF